MIKKKKTETKKSKKGKCAHLECKTMCGADEWCYGCEFFICNEHSTNPSLTHGHEVIDHWSDYEDDTEW